jgi:DNA-binding MarR family transcriptional regulator
VLASLPIPIALPVERAAFARMLIELNLAVDATTYPLDQPRSADDEPDFNLGLVAAAVMLGHSEGHPMTATEIGEILRMPRSSALGRLNALIARGMIVRIERRYYFESVRAATVPHKDNIDFILAKYLAVLGPYLSKSDT